MAIAPAATSANPAVTMIWDEVTAAESPAARAKGTVKPSAIPITTSRTDSEPVKCLSTCGVAGKTRLPRGLMQPGPLLPRDHRQKLNFIRDDADFRPPRHRRYSRSLLLNNMVVPDTVLGP